MLFTLQTFLDFVSEEMLSSFFTITHNIKVYAKILFEWQNMQTRGFLQLESEDRSVAFKRQWRRNNKKLLQFPMT